MGSKLQWDLIFKSTFVQNPFPCDQRQISFSVWHRQASDLGETSFQHSKSQLHIPWRAGHSSVPHLSTASDKSKHVTSVQNPSGAKHSMEYIFNQLICEWPKGLSQWQTEAQESSFISHKSRELKEILESITDHFLHQSVGLMTWPWGVFLKLKANEIRLNSLLLQ